jgi:CRISPR-associated protein Cas1
MEVARSIVAGKVKNARRVLVRGQRRVDEEDAGRRLDRASKSLADTLDAIKNEATLDGLRGHEGTAAKTYFEVLPHLVRQQTDAFQMNGRSRRPPRDRFNAILSFLYTILCNDCVAAAEGVGLDPQIGFLHTARPGRPSLALDLMEELRAPLVDRLALTLVNRRQLSPDDFRVREGGAVLLNDAGRKTVLVAYQERKQDTVTHPMLDREMEVGIVPHAQARLLARFLRGDLDSYMPYLPR